MGVECVQVHTLMFHVIPKQERIETNGDGVKPGYPPTAGLGGANVQLGTKRVPHWTFLPRPHLFQSYTQTQTTLTQSLRHTQRIYNLPTSLDMGVLCPLLPFGLSSPVPKGLHSSHHAGRTFRLLKKFVSCTHIIKRRTALTENPARAEE